EGANVIDGGEYHLEVESTGDWTIELTQPRATKEEAEAPPIQLEGTSSTVEGPFIFDGVEVVEVNHNGELDIIVTIWPMEGPWGDFEMPIMEAGKGTFEGTFSFNGIAWIEIYASGDWTLKIE
ncbi:hypothetical protein AKJ51_03520, partial [candidate division MSBL1 archaeon SCGC-AAA382A20]